MADYYVGPEGSGTMLGAGDRQKITFHQWAPNAGAYVAHAVNSNGDTVYCGAAVDTLIQDWAWTPMSHGKDDSLPPNVTVQPCPTCAGTPGPRATYS